ncbi:septum formation initiator family protein [Micromonosporaceae bacterium DT55]|uniref:septum formation initiator family protein n=1 Tax=Melissospora conviva TaxID=3388432 RepID=UPI003C27AA2F
MQQPRTPGGRRPARRPARPVRSGAARTTGRGVRSEARGSSGRTPHAARGGEAVRSASRPAAARRTSAKRTSAPQQRHLTGRATVLLTVLIALALAYAYPLRVYLDQQSDIARTEAAQAEQRELIKNLSLQAEKWQDPEYIEIEARRRFYMRRPGEQLFLIHDDRDLTTDPGAAGGPAPEEGETWYDTLWSSIEAADER